MTVSSEIGLKLAVEAGYSAAELQRNILPILEKRRQELIHNLEEGNFYYQKIDNSELLTIQLELKVLKRISCEINTLAKTGVEAAEKLASINNQQSASTPARPLRF